MDSYPSSRLSIQNACHSRTTRAGSRRIGISDASFPKSNFDFGITDDMDELDVGAIWKRSMPFEQRTHFNDKRIVHTVNEQRAVRVACRTSCYCKRIAVGLEWIVNNTLHWTGW